MQCCRVVNVEIFKTFTVRITCGDKVGTGIKWAGTSGIGMNHETRVKLYYTLYTVQAVEWGLVRVVVCAWGTVRSCGWWVVCKGLGALHPRFLRLEPPLLWTFRSGLQLESNFTGKAAEMLSHTLAISVRFVLQLDVNAKRGTHVAAIPSGVHHACANRNG